MSSPSSRSLPAGRLLEPQEAAGERRLAASGFADDRQRLAAPAATSDTPSTACTRASRAQRSATHRIVLHQVDDAQDGLRRSHRRPSCARKQRTVRPAASVSCGFSCAAARHDLGAARRESCSRAATRAARAPYRGSPQRSSPPLAFPARRFQAGRACRDAAGRRRSPSRVPSSTLRPAYITTHAVGGLRHDAEVVGDEQHRHAEALLEVADQLEHLRLHGDVERRRRLVGDQQASAGRRAPWRSSRAGACRPRDCAGYWLDALGRRRHADQAQQFDRLRDRSLAPRQPRDAGAAPRRSAVRPYTPD